MENYKGGKKNQNEQCSVFQGTALVAYTGHIGTDFNRAVEFHQNSHKFQFKAFHYYLTKALQLLNPGKCYTIYRGSYTKSHYSGRKYTFWAICLISFSQQIATHPLYFNGEGSFFDISAF